MSKKRNKALEKKLADQQTSVAQLFKTLFNPDANGDKQITDADITPETTNALAAFGLDKNNLMGLMTKLYNAPGTVAATPASPATPATPASPTTPAVSSSTVTLDQTGGFSVSINGAKVYIDPTTGQLSKTINNQLMIGTRNPDGTVTFNPAPATPANPVAATPVTPTPGAPAVPGTPPVVATNPTSPPAQNSLTPPPATGTSAPVDMSQMLNSGFNQLNTGIQNTQATVASLPAQFNNSLDSRFNQFAQGFQAQIGPKFEQFGQKIAELSARLESLFNRLNTMASTASTSSMGSVGSGIQNSQVAMTPAFNGMPAAFNFNFGMPASNMPFQPTTSGMSNPWSAPVNNPVSTMAPQPQLASNIGRLPMWTWS